ncbi:MAG TPA: DUF4440 domain-containing protein [Sphingomicrobium sp.]|nr:DUF4440 domain-containing protein [Sphingomicrobium sp.]
MIGRNHLLLGAALVLLPACERAERSEAPQSAAQADVAAEEQAIRANIDRWLQLVRNKDAAGIAQLYTEDGAVMAPNAPKAEGRAAIEQAWASLMAAPGFELTFAPDRIVVSESGDMALDRGTYRAGEDVGKYVVVWRKVGGEWKAAADIFNTDRPAAGG